MSRSVDSLKFTASWKGRIQEGKLQVKVKYCTAQSAVFSTEHATSSCILTETWVNNAGHLSRNCALMCSWSREMARLGEIKQVVGHLL